MLYYFGDTKIDTEAGTINVAGVEFPIETLSVEGSMYDHGTVGDPSYTKEFVLYGDGKEIS